MCAKTSKLVCVALCPHRDQPASHLVGIFFKSHSGIRGQTSRLLPSNWCLHWNHPSKPPTRTIQLSMKSATNRFDYIRVVGLAMVCAADGSINGAIRYFTPRLFVKTDWGRSKLMFVLWLSRWHSMQWLPLSNNFMYVEKKVSLVMFASYIHSCLVYSRSPLSEK